MKLSHDCDDRHRSVPRSSGEKKKDEKVSILIFLCRFFVMKYFLLLSEKQTFIVACLFFWLLGKIQTAIASVVLNFFSFFKKIKMSQKISV